MAAFVEGVVQLNSIPSSAHRLERVRVALSKRPGGDLVISHVVREVIERGLDSLERELGRKSLTRVAGRVLR